MSSFRPLAEDVGKDDASIGSKVLEIAEYGFGYHAATGEYKDLVPAGIFDPTKMIRVAPQNAASVAGLLITTEAMVAERLEKRAQSLPGGGGVSDLDY